METTFGAQLDKENICLVNITPGSPIMSSMISSKRFMVDACNGILFANQEITYPTSVRHFEICITFPIRYDKIKNNGLNSKKLRSILALVENFTIRSKRYCEL